MEKIKYVIVEVPQIYITDNDIKELWKETKTDYLLGIIYRSIKDESYFVSGFRKDLLFYLEDNLDQVGNNLFCEIHDVVMMIRSRMKRVLSDLGDIDKLFQYAQLLGDDTFLLHKPNKEDV